MIVRWLWISVATVLLFGCGEVSLNPFVETADAGTDVGNDDGGVDRTMMAESMTMMAESMTTMAESMTTMAESMTMMAAPAASLGPRTAAFASPSTIITPRIIALR